MNITALIMAGGRGERFWPKSRKALPKQFLSLTDDGKTMLQLTIERISPMVKLTDIYIVTNKSYKSLVIEQIPELPIQNILCEPVGRSTAPCVGLGAVYISKKYKDALMLVLPSDHLIKYNKQFLLTLQDACKVAENGAKLVTVGITPDYPETGYGYIKFCNHKTSGRAYAVEQFVEKPSLETAKEYLATEEYLWNSGMFVWKISTILQNIHFFLPDTYQHLITIKTAIGTPDEEQVLEQEFFCMESQSVDYGILEKAKNIYTIPGAFGWDDVGSWLALDRIKVSNEFGNVTDGNIITVNTHSCIIEGNKKLIATVGVDELIIVDTEDAIMICSKNSAGEIKEILENLKKSNRDEYI